MNELTINLHTASETPLYEQIYQHIKREIQEGRITSGEKLPSSRSLCKYLEVSRSTVELAYEQLISEGYVEAVSFCSGVANLSSVGILNPTAAMTTTINIATLCRFVELARSLYAPYAWFLPSKIS